MPANRCAIFFEGEWKSANVYNYGVIMVENSDEDIQITFYLTDAHEMNWVTEFWTRSSSVVMRPKNCFS